MNRSSHHTNEKHLTLFSNKRGSSNAFVLGFAWLSELPRAASSRLDSKLLSSTPSSLRWPPVRYLTLPGGQSRPGAALCIYDGGMGKQSPWRVRYPLAGMCWALVSLTWMEVALHVLVCVVLACDVLGSGQMGMLFCV